MAQPLDPSKDPFAPPKVPCEVQCIHCGESYESWQIEWRDDSADAAAPEAAALGGNGAWCCPTAGCDGVGFGFDIFPVDPAWVDENGEHLIAQLDDEGDEDEEDDDVGFLDERDDEEDDDVDAPIDIFDADAFWIDADRIMPRALGNSPQPPFDLPSPTKLFEASDGDISDDDIPF